MINFSTGMQGIQQLQSVFTHFNIKSTLKSDHIVLEKSQNQTEVNIRNMFTLAKFCPLFSENKIGGNFTVSMVPYRIPESFCKDSYLTHKEISSLFKKSLFSYGVEGKDQWGSINFFRKMVLPALNQGISEIIENSAKSGLPIIEIGSGVGYSLSEKVSSMTIKTQVNDQECHLLNKSIKDPIYQLDIEGICHGLSEDGKKVPLFFALNVFDTLTPVERKASFAQLSELQYAGDRILIMLDTNPFLERALENLHSLYPDHAIFPYYPAEGEANLSVIIVPIEKAPFNLDLNGFLSCMNIEVQEASKGSSSQLQVGLRMMQSKFDFKVIDLESFFTKQVHEELNEVGYDSNVYYHASFTIGQSRVTQDLVYKRVTDIFTAREWRPTDERFLNGLKKKGLKLPEQYDENFLRQMRSKGQKILGAEILVIEATKK